MLFGSREFQIMEQSIDALWQKQKVISQNISNYDTPDYKAHKLTFREALDEERQVLEGKRIKVDVTTDETTSVRPDGNNVDLASENIELYKTYLQSSYLYDKINGKFTSIRNVLQTMPR